MARVAADLAVATCLQSASAMRMTRTTPALPLALFVMLSTSANLVAPRPLGACSLASNDDHHLDPAFSTDKTAPGAVEANVFDLVHHEDDGDGGGCGTHVASCGSFGSLTIDVSATDDTAPAEKIGYRLRMIGGDAPRGLNLPMQDVRPFGSQLQLYFDVDDYDFEFQLEISAVDLNGNVGAPTVLRIVQ
jgi:hypothetical protein